MQINDPLGNNSKFTSGNTVLNRKRKIYCSKYLAYTNVRWVVSIRLCCRVSRIVTRQNSNTIRQLDFINAGLQVADSKDDSVFFVNSSAC